MITEADGRSFAIRLLNDEDEQTEHVSHAWIDYNFLFYTRLPPFSTCLYHMGWYVFDS